MAPLLSAGGGRLKSGGGLLGRIPTFTRTASGLIYADDFADLTGWTADSGWSAAAAPVRIAYPLGRTVLTYTPGGADEGGVRECWCYQEGSTIYLTYDTMTLPAGAANYSSKALYATSVDRGKTWTKQGELIDNAKYFEAGVWAPSATRPAGPLQGAILKVGSTYYLYRGNMEGGSGSYAPFSTTIFSGPSITGPWTYAAHYNGRVVGTETEVASFATSIIESGGTYHLFCNGGAVPPSSVDGYGYRATAASPTGPWTYQEKICPAGDLTENPKAYYDPTMGKYCFLANQSLPTGGADVNRLYISNNGLADWSSLTYWDVQAGKLYTGQVNTIDVQQVAMIGVPQPVLGPDGAVITDGNFTPFTYDGNSSDPTNYHWYRSALAGVLEYHAQAAHYDGTVDLAAIVHSQSHTDFVAEFAVAFETSPDVSSQMVFDYRRADAQNYYSVILEIGSAGQGCSLYKRVANVWSLVAENLFATALRRTYRVRVEVAGTSHKVYVEGVLLIDETDASLASGTSFGFRGYRCSANVWGFHVRTGNTVTITGAPTAASLHAPGGWWVAEHQTGIVHTHYPMRALGLGSAYTEVAEGIYGGDTYAYG